jgi:hypothetical protein
MNPVIGIEDLMKKIIMLEETNKKLEDELAETKEHLKKYTAPTRSKVFYEKHKEDVKQKVKEYREKTNYVANISPEKKKEYNRIAYLNKKNKMEQNKAPVI